MTLNSDKKKEIEVILYHADWCGHCINFKPTWKELTEMVEQEKIRLNGRPINIKLVDYMHTDNISKYAGIKSFNKMKQDLVEIDNAKKNGTLEGYPTIIINGEGYEKPRDLDTIVEHIKTIATQMPLEDITRPPSKNYKLKGGSDKWRQKYLKYKTKYLELKNKLT